MVGAAVNARVRLVGAAAPPAPPVLVSRANFAFVINLLLLANLTYPLLTSSQCAIVNELPCRDSSSI